MKTKANIMIIDVEPEKAFWVCDGRVIKNLKDLAKALEEMSDEVFGNHANKDKNDFANWISDVFGNPKLAAEVRTAKTAKMAAKKIKAKI